MTTEHFRMVQTTLMYGQALLRQHHDDIVTVVVGYDVTDDDDDVAGVRVGCAVASCVSQLQAS